MRRIVIGPAVVRWVAERTGDYGDYGASIGLGVATEDTLIAGVVFNEYNGANICLHVASDGSRRWLTREFLWAVFDYGFNKAKVKRITALVGEGNKPSRHFVEHIGFRLETTLSDAHPTGDMLVYVMRRENCRWLNMRRVHHELQAA